MMQPANLRHLSVASCCDHAAMGFDNQQCCCHWYEPQLNGVCGPPGSGSRRNLVTIADTGACAMTFTLFSSWPCPYRKRNSSSTTNRVTVREVRIPALSERKGKPLTIGARRDDVIQTALFVCILLEQTEEVQVFWKHRRIKH